MKEVYVDGYDTVVEFPDETPDAEIQKALASNFPETDDQFVNRIADPATPASAVSFEDFKRYQELKPDLSWGDLGNLVVQGAGVAAGELYNGVKSTANLAAQGKLGTLGASVAEGAARGTYDLASLGKRIQDNVTTMLEPYMQESGDAQKDQYNRFLAIKEMDNIRDAARKGDATILERFGIGVTPDMVDTESAEGFSYFLDPTVIGTGGSGKLASMLTRAGAKPAELAGRAAGGLARGISAAESKAADLLKSGSAKVDEMTGGLGKYAIPGSVGAAAYGAGLGATGGAAALAIGAVPALELAEGLFKGFSNSMLNNPTRIGPMRHLAMTAPATRAGMAAGWLKWMDTPLDLAAKGTTGAVIGSAYGAGLGGLAAGWEGAAQGLGAGSVLGAGTAGTMRLAEGVTGRAKVRAEENDYYNWRLEQDKDTQDFLDNNIKTHTDRVQVMDAIQLAQAGVGDQATVRVLSGDDFNARFPGADGVQVVEGDVPVAYINGRDGNSRVLFHEIFHSMARLDGFDSLVAGISNEIGKMYSPDEINSLIREYESLGKPLKESEGLVTTGDKFAALAEEIGAEYFANYIKGKDSSYLLKGTPFKDALNSITSKFVAGKLDRVYNTFQSEIFKHTHLKQSKGMDRAMNDLIKARRKAYRDVELSADDAIRAYGERDLGNDQVFKELQALGVAGLDNKGRRVMKTAYAIKKDDTAIGKEVSDALNRADPTGGMLKNADGSWVGRNFSPAQIEALLNAPGLSDKVKEVIQFIDTIRKAGSDAANVTYAAATYKTKRGKTRYKNLPISNRDALIYGIEVSPVGTMIARILDLSLLKSKIVRNWTGDSRLQRVFGSQEGMHEDALTYINALGGDTPTATVLGSQEKRNLLNKLLGVRNVKGNPEVPEGLFVKEGDHPWRSFRLDRFVKARALENTQAKFSQQAYEKGQVNFSPSKHPEALPVEQDGFKKKKNGKKEPKYKSIPYSILDSPFVKEFQGNRPQNPEFPAYEKLHYEVTGPKREQINDAIESGAVDALGDKLAVEAMKMLEYPDVASGRGWYSRMREKLKNVFGSSARMFSHLLGATSAKTPVENNFVYAADLMRRYQKGDFKRHIKSYNEMYGHLKNGTAADVLRKRKIISAREASEMSDTKLAEKWIEHYKLTPLRKNGLQYGQNSLPALKAMAEQWLIGKVTPKTPQFSMNLNGESLAATIDVWAARLMRRLTWGDHAQQWRIQPKSETGVSNEDFAFSQAVFKRAADKLGMNPDDLQAIVWFGEKHVWEQNGWTGDVGAFKSSFDEVFDVFFQEGKRPRSQQQAENIVTLLQKERLVKKDIFSGDNKNLKKHIKDYEKALKQPGVRAYVKERGLPDVLKSIPASMVGKQPVRPGQSNPGRNGQGLAEAARFSPSVTPTKSDQAYLKAVQSGDTATAQKMVDEAAKKAGYWLKAFHGTSSDEFHVFDMTKTGKGPGGPSTRFHGNAAFFTIDGPYIRDLMKRINLGSGYGNREMQLYLKPDTEKDYIPHANLVKHSEGGDESGKEIAITDPDRIKSADPVTYDDQGNVIPLSERFNQTSDDIRFSPTRQLNNRGGAVYNSPTGHRAVQTSSRAGVRVYDSAGKRVGPVFQSVEKAQDWLAKRQ